MTEEEKKEPTLLERWDAMIWWKRCLIAIGAGVGAVLGFLLFLTCVIFLIQVLRWWSIPVFLGAAFWAFMEWGRRERRELARKLEEINKRRRF